MDLTGKTFGRLTVVQNDSTRKGYVICECACGNKVSIRQTSLTKKRCPTRSCGCICKEKASETGRKTIQGNSAPYREVNIRYKTNFHVIERENPGKNNKSGYKGVWYNSSQNKYEAYISIHRKRIHLGHFAKLEDAVKARKNAEDELFAPLIAAKYAGELPVV